MFRSVGSTPEAPNVSYPESSCALRVPAGVYPELAEGRTNLGGSFFDFQMRIHPPDNVRVDRADFLFASPESRPVSGQPR